MQIRAGVGADADAITAVRVKGWQQAYAGIVPSSILDSMPYEPSQRLVSRLADPSDDEAVLVAEDAGVLVGFVNVGPYREEQDPSRLTAAGEVRAIYVDPSSWGRGAGRALLRAGVDWLTWRELTPVRLWVLADNWRTRGFYERFGFAADGATAVYQPQEGLRLDELRYTLLGKSTAAAEAQSPFRPTPDK